MFSMAVPGSTGCLGRMRKVTKPWLRGSFVLLSGNRMVGKFHRRMPWPESETVCGWEAAMGRKVAGSSVGGSVSVITTKKAVSVPVFWKRMV